MKKISKKEAILLMLTKAEKVRQEDWGDEEYIYWDDIDEVFRDELDDIYDDISERVSKSYIIYKTKEETLKEKLEEFQRYLSIKVRSHQDLEAKFIDVFEEYLNE